jgi:glycosyltransferase involved in cell wall biosynthesis
MFGFGARSFAVERTNRLAVTIRPFWRRWGALNIMPDEKRSETSFSDHCSSAGPRVTIVTIFLNAETFLVEAIESVLAQTFDDWEYLLVDDGSTDASSEIAKRYAASHPENFRYLEHPGHINRGMSAARNLGIQNARGDYIAFIDADDVWMISKLADQVAFLDAHSEIAMVCGTVIYWSSWSTGRDVVVPTGHRQDIAIYPPEASLALYPFGKADAPCPSDMMLRTRLVRSLDGFEERFTGMYEDQAFLAKLYLTAPVYFSSKTWLKYRQHSDSCVSTAHETGKYRDSRLLFLNWFETYIGNMKDPDRFILAALRRAFRPYRNPRIHYLVLLPTKLKNRFLGLYNTLTGSSA